jgi:acyl carrier protein
MGVKTLKEIENILSQEIATILSIDSSKVILDTSFHEMGIDSLSFVELLVFIEKTFNIKLMESGLTSENFRTVRSLASAISRMS